MKLKLSNNYLVMFILFLLILITYGNIFDNEMVWDDEVFIMENPDIRDFSKISKFFVYPDYGGLYRPLKSIFMTVTFKIWGLNTFGYHLNGFLLHLVSTVLIFFISSKLFKKKGIGFLCAIIFAVHPIHTERVTGITAGFDLLGIAFYLFSFLLYIKFRESDKRKYFYYSLLTFLLALLSSEEAISLPVLVLLYEVTSNHNKIKEIFNKNTIKSLFKKSSSFFLILFFYLIIRFSVLGHIARRSTYIAGSFYSTLLTMSRVILKYIGLLIFPINLSLNNTMSFSTSILELKILLSLVVILLVLFYAFKQLSKCSETLSPNKLISFAIFWFFITLLPFYNIIPITSLYAERYLYIPSLGISMLIPIFYFKLKDTGYIKGNGALRNIPTLILVFIIIVFSIGTIRRNDDWQNAEILWKRTIETSSGYSGGYNNLGMLYFGQNKNQEALDLFSKAIELENDYAPAYNNLGRVYLEQGNYNKAFELFKKSIELDPEHPDPYNNLGIIYKKAGNYSMALKYYKIAISLKSEYYKAYYNIGTLYNDLEEYDKAISAFIEAIKIRPTYAQAHNNLGISLINVGDIEGAIAEFEKALRLNPGYKQAKNNLEIAHSMSKA